MASELLKSHWKPSTVAERVPFYPVTERVRFYGGGFLPMRRVEYDHQEVPISMDKYSIHGCGRLMGTMQHMPYPQQLVSATMHITPR